MYEKIRTYVKTFKIYDLDEVAEEMGVSVSTLRDIRDGRSKNPKLSTVEAILKHMEKQEGKAA